MVGIPVSYNHQKKSVRWCQWHRQRFREPFFQESIGKALGNFAQQWDTPLVELANAETVKEKSPDLLIFHVSRCGSTLLAQLLSELNEVMVLSEPAIVNDLLMSDLHLDDKKLLVKKAINQIWSQRNGEAERLVIKMDSWHLFHIAVIQEIYPDARIIFMVREPEAVVKSHARIRGIQMVPDILNLNFRSVPDSGLDLHNYTAFVLKAFYDLMRSNRHVAHLLIEFSELLNQYPAVFNLIGIVPGEEEKCRIQARIRKDSKNPQLALIQHPEIVLEVDLHAADLSYHHLIGQFPLGNN